MELAQVSKLGGVLTTNFPLDPAAIGRGPIQGLSQEVMKETSYHGWRGGSGMWLGPYSGGPTQRPSGRWGLLRKKGKLEPKGGS